MSGDRRDLPDFLREAEDAGEELDPTPLARLPELLEGTASTAKAFSSPMRSKFATVFSMAFPDISL